MAIRPVDSGNGPSIPRNQVFKIDVLPSGFIPYSIPEKCLEVRALNLGELYYLASESLSDESLVKLYAGVILNFDVYDLSWSDFLFVATHITLFTNPDNEWAWKLFCPDADCGKIFEAKLNRDKFFEFEDMQIEGYPLIATISGRPVEFGVMTVRDHLHYKANSASLEDHKQNLFLTSHYIKNMDSQSAFELVQGVTKQEDIEVFAEVDTMLYHDVKPITLECSHCKKEAKHELGLELSLLRPFRENEEPVRNRISFGAKRPKHS